LSGTHANLSELDARVRAIESLLVAKGYVDAAALDAHGVFGWNEWAAELAGAIRDAQRAGDPDTGERYYRHWLVALERMLLRKGLAEPLSLASLRQSWQVAAERTPHGEPIRLPRSALVRAGLGDAQR